METGSDCGQVKAIIRKPQGHVVLWNRKWVQGVKGRARESVFGWKRKWRRGGEGRGGCDGWGRTDLKSEDADGRVCLVGEGM